MKSLCLEEAMRIEFSDGSTWFCGHEYGRISGQAMVVVVVLDELNSL